MKSSRILLHIPCYTVDVVVFDNVVVVVGVVVVFDNVVVVAGVVVVFDGVDDDVVGVDVEVGF